MTEERMMAEIAMDTIPSTTEKVRGFIHNYLDAFLRDRDVAHLKREEDLVHYKQATPCKSGEEFYRTFGPHHRYIRVSQYGSKISRFALEWYCCHEAGRKTIDRYAVQLDGQTITRLWNEVLDEYMSNGRLPWIVSM